MYDVRISDYIYEQAIQAATAHHISVEAFIEEAVQQRLQEEPLWLSPDQVARVREAQGDIVAGRVLNSEQIDRNLAARKSAWIEANPS